MKVDEVCSCGAAFLIEGRMTVAEAVRRTDEWRETHRHAAPLRRTRAIGFFTGQGGDDEDAEDRG